jgi:hypothetical protein
MPRYTSAESTEMISDGMCRATSRAAAVFPDAVGPMMATTSGLLFIDVTALLPD